MDDTTLEQRAAARERHVIGAGPRIAAIPDDDISPEVREMVNRLRAAIGLAPAKPLPEYTRLIAKHPEVLRCHIEFGTAVFLGQLSPRERELAVLRVGWLCRAPYEWGEHVAIGQRYDVTPEEIERIIEGSAAPGWTEHEAAIIRGVEELLGDQTLTDATYETLAKSWSEPQLIEYLMMVGNYVSTAFVQNSLRVALQKGNTGLARRA